MPVVNSSVISYVNEAKTAGWYFESTIRNSEAEIRFSVTNSDGEVFSVTSPTDPGIFQNVIGIFDGRMVKIYLNGILQGSIDFQGAYDASTGTSLNIGLNYYDFGRPWNGAIDEMRIYNRSLSDEEVQKLSSYNEYIQLRGSSRDEGLIVYWPFDKDLHDLSGNQNDGNIILPTASMVFTPDSRLFFSVRDAGEIRIAKQDGSVMPEPFVSLHKNQEIYGITADPDS